MSCPRGKASPNTHTKLRLFSDSAGFCQNPGCSEKLFRDTGEKNIHIAEMAHVFSAQDNGPRAKKELTPAERGDYSNLILLCANCHTTIDKAEEDFPDSLILEWKRNHIEKIESIFGIVEYDNRDEAREIISPILQENNTIFDLYGPMSEDSKYNPESELPQKWLEKVRTTILPNNRKLLAILDKNRKLITKDEAQTLENFRQHVDDFESVHIGESESSGIRFPSAMASVLGEENE